MATRLNSVRPTAPHPPLPLPHLPRPIATARTPGTPCPAQGDRPVAALTMRGRGHDKLFGLSYPCIRQGDGEGLNNSGNLLLQSNNGYVSVISMGNKTTVACGQCKGTGRAILGKSYSETLKLVDKIPMSGSTLAALAGCSNEAMCNRLRILEEKYSLIKSVRVGRERLWTKK